MQTKITERLVNYIELEFATSGGFINSRGERCVTISGTHRSLASALGVSVGTVKNAFMELEAEKFIISRDGLYVRFVGAPRIQHLLSSRKEPSHREELAWKEEPKHLRRMTEDEVRHMVRDVLDSCGREAASETIRCHRVWCALNRLDPWM